MTAAAPSLSPAASLLNGRCLLCPFYFYGRAIGIGSFHPAALNAIRKHSKATN